MAKQDDIPPDSWTRAKVIQTRNGVEGDISGLSTKWIMRGRGNQQVMIMDNGGTYVGKGTHIET